ncbi:hypothetical protein GUJ93_ZPchr0013g37369 [Zizania palustris]|uniref:MLLE-like domain-containing protein n=1 Tax=Zizania palustris TaxID=103762 RepID=A0A8J5WT30_ZIZPA|nr:hypothetical protein GUJ93_ZPchr0013g37369 [Zizania palustris]
MNGVIFKIVLLRECLIPIGLLVLIEAWIRLEAQVLCVEEGETLQDQIKYGALEVMLGKSGFAWDDTRKMLQCEKQQYDDHCKKNHEAKGLFGIAFPYYDTLAAIYGRDIATGEGAEGVAEAVSNMEKEIALEDVRDQDDVEERACIETPRRSVDSTSSCSKKRKKDNVKLKDSSLGDRFLDMFVDVQGELKSVCKHVGTMAESMMREAEVQDKIVSEEDTQQKLQNRAILELQKLGFTGTEVVNAALVFVKVPDQMRMLLALPDSLRREYILKMLADYVMDDVMDDFMDYVMDYVMDDVMYYVMDDV